MSQTRRRFIAGAMLLPVMARSGVATAATTGTGARTALPTLPPVSLDGGWSETALTALTVSVLDKHGITFSTIAPAMPLNSQDGQLGVHYPIKTGQVALDLTSGSANFDGGIAFSRDDASLTFTELVIDLGTQTVSAVSTVNTTAAPRTEVATFTILDAKVSASATDITLGGLRLRLTKESADAFQTTFGTAIFAVGHPYSDTAGLGMLMPASFPSQGCRTTAEASAQRPDRSLPPVGSPQGPRRLGSVETRPT